MVASRLATVLPSAEATASALAASRESLKASAAAAAVVATISFSASRRRALVVASSAFVTAISSAAAAASRDAWRRSRARSAPRSLICALRPSTVLRHMDSSSESASLWPRSASTACDLAVSSCALRDETWASSPCFSSDSSSSWRATSAAVTAAGSLVVAALSQLGVEEMVAPILEGAKAEAVLVSARAKTRREKLCMINLGYCDLLEPVGVQRGC
mmetsp:Transcript_1083/g.3232  ORF Transcript_1083/g.3232 Transcript_1083/m.3232 type:complete len:217 (+) Transcript_1083:497-1147(+)